MHADCDLSGFVATRGAAWLAADDQASGSVDDIGAASAIRTAFTANAADVAGPAIFVLRRHVLSLIDHDIPDATGGAAATVPTVDSPPAATSTPAPVPFAAPVAAPFPAPLAAEFGDVDSDFGDSLGPVTVEFQDYAPGDGAPAVDEEAAESPVPASSFRRLLRSGVGAGGRSGVAAESVQPCADHSTALYPLGAAHPRPCPKGTSSSLAHVPRGHASLRAVHGLHAVEARPSDSGRRAGSPARNGGGAVTVLQEAGVRRRVLQQAGRGEAVSPAVAVEVVSTAVDGRPGSEVYADPELPVLLDGLGEARAALPLGAGGGGITSEDAAWGARGTPPTLTDSAYMQRVVVRRPL